MVNLMSDSGSIGPSLMNKALRTELFICSSSMSIGWVHHFTLLYRFSQSNHHAEESKDKEGKAVRPIPSGATPTPSSHPSSTFSSYPAPSKAIPSKAISFKTNSASKQPSKNKKCDFADMEDLSKEELDEDMDDMDDIEDNDSSGSSVDSDHIPVKRHHTSIVTHSSKAASTPERTTAGARAHQVPSLVTIDHGAGLDNSHTELVTMDTDKPSTGPEAHNATGIDIPHVLTPVSPLAAQSQPPLHSPEPGLGSELEIPDFLTTGKYNIYEYLSFVKEPGFKDLLKKYITFELADHSDIHGSLSTSHRPKAVGWWSGRARPEKLPPYDSLNSLTNGIIKWWVYLQPHWCKVKLGKVSCVEGNCNNWECLYQPGVVMDMVIFRTIFFELLVFFTFTLLTIHFAY